MTLAEENPGLWGWLTQAPSEKQASIDEQAYAAQRPDLAINWERSPEIQNVYAGDFTRYLVDDWFRASGQPEIVPYTPPPSQIVDQPSPIDQSLLATLAILSGSNTPRTETNITTIAPVSTNTANYNVGTPPETVTQIIKETVDPVLKVVDNFIARITEQKQVPTGKVDPLFAFAANGSRLSSSGMFPQIRSQTSPTNSDQVVARVTGLNALSPISAGGGINWVNLAIIGIVIYFVFRFLRRK